MGLPQARWMVDKGKSQSKMDDEIGYPNFRKHPNIMKNSWELPLRNWEILRLAFQNSQEAEQQQKIREVMESAREQIRSGAKALSTARLLHVDAVGWDERCWIFCCSSP